MNKTPFKYKTLIFNILGGGIAFPKAKIVNITLLLLILLQSLVSSCEHVSEEELRQALEQCGDTIFVNDGWEDTININYSKQVEDIRGPDGS